MIPVFAPKDVLHVQIYVIHPHEQQAPAHTVTGEISGFTLRLICSLMSAFSFSIYLAYQITFLLTYPHTYFGQSAF